MKILVLHDSKECIDIILKVINQLGHEAITLSIGDEIIDAFVAKRPDLIIFNMNNYSVEGLESIKKIRIWETNSWTPVLYLNFSNKDIGLIHGFQYDRDEYLVEPFTDVSLTEKINKMQSACEEGRKIFEASQYSYLFTPAGNDFQEFAEEVDEHYRQTVEMEFALKFALEKKEFYLVYQPIYNLSNLEVEGLEVFVRWYNPRFGLVSPNIFIPIAEKTDLIVHLGEWIISTACQQASQWPMDQFKNFRITINISAKQLIQDNFYFLFLDILKKYQLSPHRVQLEFTEIGILSHQNDLLKETLIKLHDVGANISIDDFGIGYTSLIRLKSFPINTLKFEKFFIQDAVVNENGAIIIDCLISLGKQLGLNVIAEGIESEEQLAFLIQKGCDQGQGFFLSKPLTAEGIRKFLNEKYLLHGV